MEIEQPDERVDRFAGVAEQVGGIPLDLERGGLGRRRRENSLGFGERLLRTAIHQIRAGEAKLD
jgi:hypothetical protein